MKLQNRISIVTGAQPDIGHLPSLPQRGSRGGARLHRRIDADDRFCAQHARRREVSLCGHAWRGVGVYDVDYRMPFHFHSDEIRPNYLFLSCHRGSAAYAPATLAPVARRAT